MGAVVPGTNGTLKSNTIENMLYEALNIAINWENDQIKNPTGEKRITLTEDKSAKQVTASFDFKINRDKTTVGATSFPVQSALVGTGYTAGTTPAIVSDNIYAAIVEICEEIQRRDADSRKNPQSLNTVTTLNYVSESLTVSGSITLVVDASTDNFGNVVTRARAYLLDV